MNLRRKHNVNFHLLDKAYNHLKMTQKIIFVHLDTKHILNTILNWKN